MSSIASTVNDLSRRIAEMLDLASRAGLDTLASDLAAVERSLLAARRKLEQCSSGR
jgi:hypothetical protein